MSYSFTSSESTTFTLTHAKHIAAKVATDLKRIQRLYGAPSDQTISEYEAEVIELLKAGYLDTVTYGYKRNGSWIEPTLRYTSHEFLNSTVNDDDPGKIRPGANITGANFTSYLIYSPAWFKLTANEQEVFEEKLPFKRTGLPEPSISGYLENDRTYSSGGRALNRKSVRSY